MSQGPFTLPQSPLKGSSMGTLTSTSSPLGLNLNHFTMQVRPTWSPDCTTPYTAGSGQLWTREPNRT
jgi:hypothetical protein